MSRPRLVTHKGNYLEIDRADHFQTVHNSSPSSDFGRRGVSSIHSKPTLSRDLRAEGMPIVGDPEWQSQSDISAPSSEDESVEEKRERAAMSNNKVLRETTNPPKLTIGLCEQPEIQGYDAISDTLKNSEKRKKLSPGARALKSFIDAAIDPHWIKFESSGNVYFQDSVLNGYKIDDLVESMSSSQSYLGREEELLQVIREMGTHRVLAYLHPSKRKEPLHEVPPKIIRDPKAKPKTCGYQYSSDSNDGTEGQVRAITTSRLEGAVKKVTAKPKSTDPVEKVEKPNTQADNNKNKPSTSAQSVTSKRKRRGKNAPYYFFGK